jgi:cytoskeletal protein CcmA (bactofilin family)
MSAEDRSGDTGGVPSIIGTDLKIVGDLKSTGDIQIDGTIEGNIEGPLLTVTEQGKIDGSTVANTVLIFGTVNGQVQAKTVHLRSGARVAADIIYESFTMEPGAYFEGGAHFLKGARRDQARSLVLNSADAVEHTPKYQSPDS